LQLASEHFATTIRQLIVGIE